MKSVAWNGRTGLLVGAPLLLAGSAASAWLLYRASSGAAGRPEPRRRRNRRVREIMTENPACCTADTPIRQVAEMMVTNDCGEIPICDQSRRVVGVVTDRDVVCRLVATGHNPLEATARDCMSRPVVTCTPDMSVEDCARLMERHQIRRIPVTDAMGALCGMVSQADVVRQAPRATAAELVEEVSQPNVFASRAASL
ncbi:MAG TPA: CBS domain-containing protein [Candidatus Binatia bacterium]|nr:CBS domain-containing protein [Candidatus Binatia bacterium]